MVYSIAIDDGPVNDLKFCPSGSYSDDRLGLLAVAGYSDKIQFLALPKHLQESEPNQAVMLQPSAILTHFEKINGRAMKLAWTSAKGHAILAAGYSNGQVAIWNLATLSPLLIQRDQSGTATIHPMHTIFAHQDYISGIELHVADGQHFLATSSLDRRVKFYNLGDTGCNVPEEIFNSYNKARIMSCKWPQTMIFLAFGMDTDYCYQQSEIRGMLSSGAIVENRTFFSMMSTVTDFSINEWTNVIGVATLVGDVLAYQTKEYFDDPKRRIAIAIKTVSYHFWLAFSIYYSIY